MAGKYSNMNIDEVKQLAENGVADAQDSLGCRYVNGDDGLSADHRIALKWFILAANGGSTEGMYHLGVFYEAGMGGLAQNFFKAKSWYEKAAEKGHPDAQCNLGALYGRGDGVPVDYQKSAYWLRKAANQGNDIAKANLDDLIRSGLVPKSFLEKSDYEIKNHCLISYKGTETELEIPDGVTEIGSNCFRNSFRLRKIVLPSSVVRIGKNAFRGCVQLTDIKLGESLQVIDDYAFSECFELVSVIMPQTIKKIGEFSFRNCESLHSISIPKSASYNDNTFACCEDISIIRTEQEYSFKNDATVSDDAERITEPFSGTKSISVESTSDNSSNTNVVYENVDQKDITEIIRKRVAEYYGVSVSDMDSSIRLADIALPRMVAMYLIRTEADLSLPKIGKLFGGRHYSTVIHAVEKIEEDIQNNSKIKNDIESIKNSLKAGHKASADTFKQVDEEETFIGSTNSNNASNSVLTKEQQRQKEELKRQMDDLKSQAAYYSSQNLSAEDRETLNEAEKEIDRLSKQVDGISTDQAKFEEHLRQKEEQKKKAEEEKARRKAEILAKGNADDVSVDMFVILTNEKGIGKLNRNQTDFCNIYEEDFPTLNKKQMVSMRKEILGKMKDRDFCEAYTERFKERSVKERFSVSTRNFYNMNTGDFGKKVEEAIDGTACWYSREEFKEVRTLMDKHMRDQRKKLDDQLAPVEQGWTKFSTARKDLVIVIKNDGEINDNNECFQVRTGGALVEVDLITGGLLKLSVTLMNCFPWYWDKEVIDIWEAALKNEVRDESTGWFDNERLAQQAVREIRGKFPAERDYYHNKGNRFIQELVKLYGQTDPVINPVKAIKDTMKGIFPNEKEFGKSRKSLAESNSLIKVPVLKQLLDSGIPSAMVYEEIPEALGSEIEENNKRKLEAKKNRCIQEAKDALSDETLSGLSKAIELLKRLKEYDDVNELRIDGKGVDDLIKQCSEKIESVKEAQYQEALKLIEGGTEESLSKAERMLSELPSYKDAEDKIKEAKDLHDMLRRYVNAQSMMANANISIVKKAEDAFRELGDYKDSAEKAKACAERIISIKADKYVKANSLAEEGTVTSISSALALLREISPFEDAENKIIIYQKLLDNEKVYSRAVSMLSGIDITNLIAVKEAFEGLGAYKDSAIKAAACGKYLNDLCEKKYQEAKDAQAVFTVESQTLAIAAYNELGDFKDALKRIAICTSNITVIQEIIEIEEQLARHKEELKSLTGFFKRKQRQEKEELIKSMEKQYAELRDQLM